MNISILSLCQAHSIYIFWAKVTLWLLFFFLHIQKPLKGMKFFSIKSFQKKKICYGVHHAYQTMELESVSRGSVLHVCARLLFYFLLH